MIPVPGSKSYDVFLAHGTGDKPLVRKIYEALTKKGYSVFLDAEELVPGETWRVALEDALSASRCLALCVGPVGPGPWTEFEVNFALRRSREDPSYPLIPLLIEGGSRTRLEELSSFLLDFQVIDLSAEILEEAALLKLTESIERALSGTAHGGLAARKLPLGDVQEDLKRLQERFYASLRPLLAGGQLIERQEAQEVLKHLGESDTRIVVVHGVAGAGKSGVLLEVADKLSEDKRPFLPLRLDRHLLQGTPQKFAATELLLPGSPGRCLARIGSGELGAVLLLDQLDALRWTGAHSSEAWDVCREMILEALDASPETKVVVCCRTFDLQHDPQFRSWKEQSKNLRELPVGELTDQQVQAAINRAASSKGDARPIDERELKLLRHVHHLQIWLTLYPRLGLQGSLGSRRALMEAFWQDRRTKLAEVHIPPERIEGIEARLVDEMQEGARLRAPLGALRLSRQEFEAYQSLQILQLDPTSNSVSFCHQTYLDYLVALRIVGDLEKGRKSLLTWLGARDEQSLFRREQLRLVLEELRERDTDAYVAKVRSLLAAGDAVRFHLRLLCLQFLSQIGEPSAEERELVLGLLADTYWRDHVMESVVRGQVAWVEVLDDAGVLEKWLAADDGKFRDSALQMLLYVVEQSGDRIARLLRQYIGAGPEWTHRILWVLRFDPSKDSDALFELRIELAKQGAYTAEHVDWRELAERHPIRFLILVFHLLLALTTSILEGQERKRAGRRSELDWHGLEAVSPTMIPVELRSPAWELLFKAVTLAAQVRRYPSEDPHVLESHAIEIETLEPVIDLLRGLGRTLLEENWQAFVSLGENLVRDSPKAEIVFLDCLREGPATPGLADWALDWLMRDSWRLQLRVKQVSSEWKLSSLLIERYAPVCSEETFRRLEEWLLCYCEPELLRRYRRRHEWLQEIGDLARPSCFGSSPHKLLPKLPADRVSAAVPKRIAELERKFGASESSFEERKAEAGFVGSPLGHQALKQMPDDALLKLVASTKLGGNSKGGRLRWKGDHFEAASPETIASDFRVATQHEPGRFGWLVVRWPSEGHPEFLKAILSGLAFPGDDRRGLRPETWKPPSHQLLEEVLSLPVVQALAWRPGDTEVAKNLCDFLQRYAEYAWTDTALKHVVRVAQQHPDPKPDYYPLGSRDDNSGHSKNLESNALNVTRGRAGYAIRSLLFHHPEFFAKLRPAIESLIRDPHPAVTVAALGACLPVIKIDRDQAVEWFLEACVGPDQILSTSEAESFFRYSYQSHLSQLLPILDRMVDSPLPKVVTAGARWMAAAFLVLGEARKRFERCIAGTPEQRKGVAQVATSLIGAGEYADKAKAVLLRLADDPDEKVLHVVAGSFDQLDLQHITADREAWRRFARSKAFQADPTPLLQSLGNQSGDLLPFADCLLAAGTTFSEELAEAASDYSRGVAGDARIYLLPLLLRLYEQAKDRDRATYHRTLDLWDRLLEKRVGSAMGLTHELDRL